MSPTLPYTSKKEDLYYPGKNPSYFEKGPPKSDASLCVELARLAYSRNESDFAFDRHRVETILGKIGFSDCQFFESTDKPRGEGSHCFLAQNPERKLAVVAFRGTDKDDPTDLLYDAEAEPVPWKKPGKVHAGFARALDEVERPLGDALNKVQYRTLFTGHSLGAAMATLMASLRAPSALHTFGSPRVGNADFVATLQGIDNHRYVDCCDLVARVLPEGFLGYHHLGPPYYIAENRKVMLDPGKEFMKKDRFQAAEDYLKHVGWKIGNVGLRELADHAPLNYVWPVTAQS